jgi:hypothetical protein
MALREQAYGTLQPREGRHELSWPVAHQFVLSTGIFDLIV